MGVGGVGQVTELAKVLDGGAVVLKRTLEIEDGTGDRAVGVESDTILQVAGVALGVDGGRVIRPIAQQEAGM